MAMTDKQPNPRPDFSLMLAVVLCVFAIFLTTVHGQSEDGGGTAETPVGELSSASPISDYLDGILERLILPKN